MPLTGFELLLYSITFLTVITQLYVFYLVQRKSPRNMKDYRFYLNYFTFFDLMFTLVLGGFLQPDPVGKSVSVRVLGVVSYLGPRAQIITISFMLYAVINVILSQDYCLLYRFSAVHSNRNFQQFFVSNRAKIYCFIFAQIFSIFIGIFGYNVFVSPEKFTADYFTGQQLENFREFVRPGEFIIWVDESSKLPKIFLSIAFSFFLTSELASIYLIYSILSVLKKRTKNFSKNTYKLHFQLTLLLGVQLALPLVLIILPVTIRWVRALLEYEESSLVNHIRIIFISLYGFANSFFTLLFVAPYRHHTYEYFIHPWLRPILVVLKMEHLTPKRKSTAWVTGTRPGLQPTTLRSSVVMTD